MIHKAWMSRCGFWKKSGVVVLPSNAQATRFAAALIRPELVEDS